MSEKKIWIITLFPKMFESFFNSGVVGRAFREEMEPNFQVEYINPANYSEKGYKGVDAAPYGGGPGMVMRADVLSKALNIGIFANYSEKNFPKIIYPNPKGQQWNNVQCRSFANNHIVDSNRDLVFIAGRYEGVDERFIEKYVDLEYSVGDFVLSGGELAIMTIIDSSFRFIPNLLGNNLSANEDSFEDNLIDSPKYTRPADFEGVCVPDVLLSGDHKKISLFNRLERERLTKKYREDLSER